MIPITKNLFLGKYFTKVAIYHCGDSIEGKCVAAVAELKRPDCGNATKETDKDAEDENLDFVDEDIINSNHMDYKLYCRRVLKKHGLIKCYSHQ